MTDTLTADFRAKRVETLVDEGSPWSIRVTYPTSLVGATITARFLPNGGALTSLTVIETDLEAGIFHFGQAEATVSGVYDVRIALAGDPVPTMRAKGRLYVEPDLA